jgi:hypothetical protein
MALYFFDTDDGETQFRDEIGVEFDDDQAARNEGSRAIAEMAQEYVAGGPPQKNITMWIRNADGTALLEMSISFAIKPLR